MSVLVEVFYDQFVIGTIEVGPAGALGFRYGERWLASSGAFPLSVKMPLRPAPFDDEVIKPWLANLLPEEQQLLAVSRTLGLSTADTLAILTEIGGDTAGAISIGAPSLRDQWSYRTLTEWYGEPDATTALSRHIDDLSKRPFLVGEDGVRQSLAGGQTKTALAVLAPDGKPKIGLPASEDRLAVPMFGAPSTLILKPDNPNLPGIVENECYCLTLAGMIGIEAATAQVVPFGKRTALAVLRYDRQLRADGSIRRLHQEDFAQANGLFPSQKYEQGTVAGLDMTGLLRTGRYLSSTDALRLLDQVIFNILVANTDAHAKNFSMLLNFGPRLAPLYDVSTVLGWDHVNQNHAQKLAGRKRKPEDMAPRHWDQIAKDAGLSPRGVRLRVEQLVDAMVTNRVETEGLVMDQAGAEPGMVRHVAGLIEQNALRIAGRLRKGETE